MKDAITFGLALLGSVLGVINTWRAINRDRVKLRVGLVEAPTHNLPEHPVAMMGFEVTNLSTFPVTVAEIGLMMRNTDSRTVVPNPRMFDDGKFPRRLGPREQFIGYIDQPTLVDLSRFRAVFASTVCGETFESRIHPNKKRPKRHLVGNKN